MANSTILVTGASGATGGSAISALVEHGHHVRAFVHEEDTRSEALRASGVEVVTGDLLDIDSVRAAMEGVNAAYFVYPLGPGLLAGTVNFAQAAKEAGVSAIVSLSQMTARRDSLSHAAKDHWLSEQVLAWCGVPVTILRPTLFAEWLLYPFSWKDYVRKDTLALPFGDGKIGLIAAEDQGRAIASVLSEPAKHAGKLYKLLGPVELDWYGIAAAMSEVLGRTITYTAVSVEEFLVSLARVPGYSSPFLLQHIGAIALDAQNGITGGTSSAMEHLTGRPGMTVQEFVKKHRAAFEISVS
jgi:NAD(P)H dehydrogenase (quinone)